MKSKNRRDFIVFRNFYEIEEFIKSREIKKRIALCGAHDESALSAVVDAVRKGVITGILIGDEARIVELLAQMDEPGDKFEIIDLPRDKASAKMAVQMVHEGRADIPMKGCVPSATYLMPIVDPVNGLVEKGMWLSAANIVYFPARDALIIITDPAMNIAPTLDVKVKIIKNAVKLARLLGFEKVRVAALSALEQVNPEVYGSTDAKLLADMEWGEDVIVAGPLALDNALDSESATKKGITGGVVGNADILLAPEICSGNILFKGTHFFGNLPSAGVVCGSKSPIVFTSRSDSAPQKYNSILTAILQSMG